MLFINHQYNRDRYFKQREKIWKELNKKLDLKGLHKKTNCEVKMKYEIEFKKPEEVTEKSSTKEIGRNSRP